MGLLQDFTAKDSATQSHSSYRAELLPQSRFSALKLASLHKRQTVQPNEPLAAGTVYVNYDSSPLKPKPECDQTLTLKAYTSYPNGIHEVS